MAARRGAAHAALVLLWAAAAAAPQAAGTPLPARASAEAWRSPRGGLAELNRRANDGLREMVASGQARSAPAAIREMALQRDLHRFAAPAAARRSLSQVGGDSGIMWEICTPCYLMPNVEMCGMMLAAACADPSDPESPGQEVCDELNTALELMAADTDPMAPLRSELTYQNCLHPYLWTAGDMSFFMNMSFGPPIGDAFAAGGVDGASLATITVDQMNAIGVQHGMSVMITNIRDSFYAPKPPTNLGQKAGEAAKVEVSFTVKSVSSIDATEFTFEAEFVLNFVWTDAAMWAACDVRGDDVDSGLCAFGWKPEVKFPNEQESEVISRWFQTDPTIKYGFYQLGVRGKFSAPMGFQDFPSDTQELPIQLILSQNIMRERVMFSPVQAQFQLFADTVIRQSSGSVDFVAGWDLKSVVGQEAALEEYDWNAIAGDADGAMRAMLDYYSETYDLDPESFKDYKSLAQATIVVERKTNYYLLNYVLVVVMLTSLSWVTFLLDEGDLNDRMGVALTLILALNFFQLLLSEAVPETGYLTAMHQFIIGSTLYVVLAAAESMAAAQLSKRSARRAQVLAAFSGALGGGGGGSVESATAGAASLFKKRAKGPERVDESTGGAVKVGGASRMIKLEEWLAERLDYISIVVFPASYAIFVGALFA